MCYLALSLISSDSALVGETEQRGSQIKSEKGYKPSKYIHMKRAAADKCGRAHITETMIDQPSTSKCFY